jgi:hypothetical protein
MEFVNSRDCMMVLPCHHDLAIRASHFGNSLLSFVTLSSFRLVPNRAQISLFCWAQCPPVAAQHAHAPTRSFENLRTMAVRPVANGEVDCQNPTLLISRAASPMEIENRELHKSLRMKILL